jgi:DNA-binding HxlR family transcriptional regulator
LLIIYTKQEVRGVFLERKEITDEDREYIRRRLGTFSQKWTMRVIATISQSGSDGVGFNELMKHLDGISAAVLSKRLKVLQKSGFIERRVNIGPPTRTKYLLLSDTRQYLEKIANWILDRRDSKS